MASSQRKAFALRIEPRLWQIIERLAAVELRSANAQIEILLREALAQRGVKAGAEPGAGLPERPEVAELKRRAPRPQP